MESDHLAAGDRLPPERELATQLGVSRNSLRPALAALEALGVIEIRHGSGAVLRQSTIAEVAERLSATLADHSRDLPAVLEARVGLERFAAALAAERGNSEDIERLEEAARTMRADVERGESGVTADAVFHRALAAASHNEVLITLLDSIAGPVARIREESLAQPGRAPRSIAGHQRIIEAVRSGDAAAAVQAVDAHLTEVGDTLLVRGRESPGHPAGREPDTKRHIMR